MDKNDKKLAQICRILEEIEEKTQTVKRMIFEQVHQDQAENMILKPSSASNVIEGIFDGETMIDRAGQKHLVPTNYCSKSKLVPGDNLKLTITPDGTFIYKQIGPVDRRRLVAKLIKSGDNWLLSAEGKKYRCLKASVSYFKAKEGDKVAIIVPKTGESEWAAIENVIEKN